MPYHGDSLRSLSMQFLHLNSSFRNWQLESARVLPGAPTATGSQTQPPLKSSLKLSKVLQEGGSWPLCALCLSMSEPRLDTGIKSESALTSEHHLPQLDDSLRPHPTQLLYCQRLFQGLAACLGPRTTRGSFSGKQLASACAAVFLKNS